MPVNDIIGGHKEEIVHWGGIRLRVGGEGNLQMVLLSLDGVDSYTVLPLPMQTFTSREPTRLTNFNSQRTLLRVFTNQLADRFVINRIILFAKPIWSQFPG